MSQAPIVNRDALEQSAQPDNLVKQEQQLKNNIQQAENATNTTGGPSKFYSTSTSETTAVDIVAGGKAKVSNFVMQITDQASQSSTVKNNNPWETTNTGKGVKSKTAGKMWQMDHTAAVTQQRNGLSMVMGPLEKRRAWKDSLKKGLKTTGDVYSRAQVASMSVTGSSYSGAHTTSYHANISVSSASAQNFTYSVEQAKQELAVIKDIRDNNPTTANLVDGINQGNQKAEERVASRPDDENVKAAKKRLKQQAQAS